MKAKTFLSLLALFCLAVSCQTGSFVSHNDVFTRSTDAQYQRRAQRDQAVVTQHERENLYNDDLLAEEEYYEEEYYDDASGTANLILLSVDDLDMYDFFWTARLRRFHTHVSFGWGFYDPFFTNMFWYTHSPSMWGVSIYLGHSFWWPSPFFRPWHFNWGWHNWGWSWGWGWGWHRPWRFGGPWGGWSDGFNAGFWAGYYHNRFDNNRSFFYGHRNTIGGPSTGRNSSRRVFGPNDDETIRRTSRSVTGDSFNQRYEAISREEGTGRRGTGTDVRNERGTADTRQTDTRQTDTRQTDTRQTTTPTTRQTDTRQTTTPTTRQTDTRQTTTPTTRQTETRPTTPTTRQTETRPTTPTTTRQTDTRTTTPSTPSTRQTDTRTTTPGTPSTRQDTYNSGFRPDNSRNTPTHTPSQSRGSGSSFSSPSGGSSPSSSGFSSPSGGRSSGGGSAPSGGSSGGSSGNTRR